jgi:uncharacterized membrane protein
MSDIVGRPSSGIGRPSTRTGRTVVGRDAVRSASLGLALAGVLTQIAYPLLSGTAVRTATILSVLLLAAAALTHVGATWGRLPALNLLLGAGGLGLVAETIGVHTGFPFGTYAYADTLGPRLAGVPLVVPLAWTMLAYPCLLLGRRLSSALSNRSNETNQPGRSSQSQPDRSCQSQPDQSSLDRLNRSRLGQPDQSSLDRLNRSRLGQPDQSSLVGRLRTAGIGGLGLAGWDLFLDPQMVAQGHWTWAHPTPALPGVPGVPLTNYAGWLLVSVLMIAVLDRALPFTAPSIARGGESTPALVLAWTWWGSAVGNLVFFDRPWVALYGGVVMGVVVLPYLLLLRADQRKPEQKTDDLRQPDQRATGPRATGPRTTGPRTTGPRTDDQRTNDQNDADRPVPIDLRAHDQHVHDQHDVHTEFRNEART